MPPALPPLLVPPLPSPVFGDPPAAGEPYSPLLPCAGGTPVRDAASSLLPGVRPPSRDAASPLRPGERDCCMHCSRAEPVSPSHELRSVVVPAVPLRVPVLLPSPAALLLDVPEPAAPLLVVPVLLPLPERLVLPLTSPLAAPLAEPAALPLADPAVEPVPLRVSAASDAAENASDTAAAIASIRCLVIIGTPSLEKNARHMRAQAYSKQSPCRGAMRVFARICL